ncbi:MAG: 4-alpha-glucanotransferase [Luteolibacter sp.]
MPATTTRRRTSGILIPTFSARRKGDLGIGDTLAMREWVDWAADYEVGFLQLLPINENGVEESPYSAISSAALDPIYLAFDQGQVPGLTPSELDRAREHLGAAAHADQVDYPAVRAVKRNLLELAWAKFDQAPQYLHDAFEVFRREEQDWLDDYCLFRFLMETHPDCRTWDQWPRDCRTPEAARQWLRKQKSRDLRTTEYRLGFFAFVQWLCYRQWRDLRIHADHRGVKLMGDIPIGVSWHSCDVFFHRDEFHLDWYFGSPPEGMGQSDPFFQQWGQNWGLPLYRWDHMEANGFTWWRERISRITEFFRIFRLDHILGFYRAYIFPWKPEDNPEYLGLSLEAASTKNRGRLPRWVHAPDDTVENKAANRANGDLRLRGILSDVIDEEIIAEDLGWVPEYVRPHLADLHITSFRIPHWDCNEFGHPNPGNSFPELTFATYSTHDHDPVNAIWNGCHQTIQAFRRNPDENRRWHYDAAVNTLRLLSEFAGMPLPEDSNWPPYSDAIHWRLIKTLYSSNSIYAVIMVTELFRLDDRINRPGESSDRNWRFRLPWTLDEIRSDPHLSETCLKLRNIIGITGR